MQNTIFAVNDEPYCLWEHDLIQRNIEFINGLDPDYFDYVLRTHLKSEDEKRAIISLRQSLHHAVETMFTLLGALVQAPDCAYGWIAKCSTTQLREVVGRIQNGDPQLITKLAIPVTGWRSIATAIFAYYLPGTDKHNGAIEGFTSLWEILSREFIGEIDIDEYNSLKHGFRVRSGGFKLAFGIETTPGEAAPSSAMKTIGNSNFGATFFRIEKLGSKKSNPHIRSRRTSVNWSFERTVLLLELVHMAISNIISALKIVNGIPPSECKFTRPSKDSDFTEPWRHTIGVTSMNVDFTINESLIPDITKSEIRERLHKNIDSFDKN